MFRVTNLALILSSSYFYKVLFALFWLFFILNVNFYANNSFYESKRFNLQIVRNKYVLKKNVNSFNEDKRLPFNQCNFLNYSQFNYSIYFNRLCDLIITVKTTKKYHNTRLKEITETWVQMIKSKVLKPNLDCYGDLMN